MAEKKKGKGRIRRAIASLFDLYYPENMVNGMPSNEMDESYLFDFRNYQANGQMGAPTVMMGSITMGPNGQTSEQARIKASPKDVVKELEVPPNQISLNALDDKIAMLKTKAAMIRQMYSKRDVEGLIARLENRRKYKEHRVFFDAFPNTTDEAIEALTKKYELCLKTADLFIPEFPDVAVKVMKEYESVCMQVCGKKPVFYVIATEDCFKAAFKKRDPILLVQSPFGFYWQICGAWDREMLILSEL